MAIAHIKHDYGCNGSNAAKRAFAKALEVWSVELRERDRSLRYRAGSARGGKGTFFSLSRNCPGSGVPQAFQTGSTSRRTTLPCFGLAQPWRSHVKQWDSYQWQFPHGAHPCIVVSPPARCGNTDCPTVNVIGCSSRRAAREPLAHEVLLDAADGMDWSTLARCDVIYLAYKADLKKRRGSVTAERRRALGAKIIRLFGFWLE